MNRENTGDLRKLLEYAYSDELADYCDENDFPFPRESDPDKLLPIERKAAEDHEHIFGSIVRLGRAYLEWDK